MRRAIGCVGEPHPGGGPEQRLNSRTPTVVHPQALPNVVKFTTSDAVDELARLPLEATVAMADVAAAMREGLLAFATSAGLVVMCQMLDAELTGVVDAKHERPSVGERVGNWHGTTTRPSHLGCPQGERAWAAWPLRRRR